MARILIASALLFSSIAFAQAPAFEVASITPCPPGTPAPMMEHAGVTDFIAPGGLFRAQATTIEFLMEWAWGMQPSQHSAGPAWMRGDRYDVTARAHAGANENEMRAMVRTLLAERFHLKLQKEQREMSALVIAQGKAAPKITPAASDETHTMRFSQQAVPNQKTPMYHIVIARYTFQQLADTFARTLGSVIVNETGIEGEFDFTLDFAPDDAHPNPMDPALLLASLREQVGLSVKSQKAPVDYYTIENADKLAAAN